jgi:hypothetical protein
MTTFSPGSVVEIRPTFYEYFLAWFGWGPLNFIGLYLLLLLYWFFSDQTRIALNVFWGLSIQALLIFIIGYILCVTTRYVVNVKEKKIEFIKKQFSLRKKYAGVCFSQVKMSQ